MKTEYVVGNIRIGFASQRRRRIFVAFVYVVLGLLAFAWFSDYARGIMNAWISGCLILGVALYLIFTSIAGDMRARGDERETHRRDHAHYVAYYFLGYGLVGALFSSYFRGPNPITPLLPQVLQGFLIKLPALLLAAAGILYLTLPQAILLWTERDMDLNPKPVTR